MTSQEVRVVDLGGRCESPIPCHGNAEVWSESQRMWLCRKCHSMLIDAQFGMGDRELDIEELSKIA